MADIKTKIGFLAAVGSLVILYFASGSPISLYSMWQEELGLTHAQLSMASMWYLLGTVIPLLFLPRISDHLGRRPATVMILLVSMCGVVTFMMVDSPEMIMLGRLIQGIASGLGSSTVAAYVVDLSSDLPRWVGPMITSSAPTLGLSTGAFVSGGLVSHAGVPSASYFEAVIVLVAIFLVLVLFSKETVSRAPGLLRSLVPKFTLPARSGRLFAACAMIFVGTWAVGGFSQSFSATIAYEYLGSTDALVAAVVFTSLLLPNAVGSYFAKRFEVRQAQLWGMGAYVACAALMWASLAMFHSLLLFCTFSVVAGFAQGIAFAAGVTELMGRASKAQRAGTFSTIYLMSYGGSAIPNLVVGMVAGNTPVETIFSWYVIMLATMFVVLAVLASRPYPKAEASEVLAS